MFLRIDPDSEIPLYTQLIYQIKRGIVRKELLPDEILPSVRRLAGEIGINLHTVNKAYQLLEEEGILRNQKKRYIVNQVNRLEINAAYLEVFQEKLTELMIDAQVYHLTEEELGVMKDRIRKEIKERAE